MKTQILRVLIAPITFAVLWNLTAPLFALPGLAAIGRAIVEMIDGGTYVHDVLISLYRGLSGFLMGFSLGFLTGLVTGRFASAFLVMGGLLNFLRWTPVLALLPISIRIGGLGEAPKLFLIAWACFFVAWVYTHTAVSKLNPSYIMWADSLGLGLRDRIFRIFAPAISPAIVGGARVALALGIIVVVAAELGGTYNSGFFREGLGYRISRAIETNRNDINIACIFTFGMMGMLLDFLLVLFARRGLKRLTGMDFYRNDP
jgi:ABC-type nitrate/sulfonate/bicarbonate transport system permease component